VLRFCPRISALLLTLALASSNVALCAGWMPTAEQRMACCAEGGACPMHKSDGDGAQEISQAEADACCAASDDKDSTPRGSSNGFVVLLAPVQTVVHLIEPVVVRSDARRAVAPIPGTSVPKHVFLSVFLV
jgi:hypothetical protein